MSPDPATHPLRRAREAKRMPDGKRMRLEDLAGVIGKSASMLSNAERGYVPRPGTQLKIAEALDVDVREIWPDEWEAEQ